MALKLTPEDLEALFGISEHYHEYTSFINDEILPIIKENISQGYWRIPLTDKYAGLFKEFRNYEGFLCLLKYKLPVSGMLFLGDTPGYQHLRISKCLPEDNRYIKKREPIYCDLVRSLLVAQWTKDVLIEALVEALLCAWRFGVAEDTEIPLDHLFPVYNSGDMRFDGYVIHKHDLPELYSYIPPDSKAFFDKHLYLKDGGLYLRSVPSIVQNT